MNCATPPTHYKRPNNQSNEKMPSPKDDVNATPPCHPRACAIQDCLTRNNYNEARCQGAIKALYECCAAFYEKHGDEATSPSCPKPDLLRLKMKQLNMSSSS